MATYFIKIAQKIGDGIVLTGMVTKGVLKDSLDYHLLKEWQQQSDFAMKQ